MPLEISLVDKSALVTGAGSGIGQAIAVAFASIGADVVINDINEKSCLITQDRVQKLGRKGIIQVCDVSDEESVSKMVDKAIEQIGKIDILVNNAGVIVRKSVFETKVEEWDKIMSVNLKGAFLCSKHIAKRMVEKGVSGRIINISSIMGAVALPPRAAYCASKGGIIALTNDLAAEFAEHKINVNAIGPGWVLTNLTEKYFAQEDVKNYLLDRVPLKRFGTTSDVANLACFLASDLASYMTGQTIFLDGGWTAL